MVLVAFIINKNAVLKNVKAEWLRSGGCGQFSAEVLPNTVRPEKNDEVAIWSNGVKIYSGVIVEISGTEITGWQISGLNTTLHDYFSESGLIIPPLSERASWMMLKSFLTEPGFAIEDISTPELYMSTSRQITEIDLGGKTIFEILSEFSLKTQTPICWGVNADNELYVYPVHSDFGVTHKALRSSLKYTYYDNGIEDHGSVRFVSTIEQRFPPLHDNCAFTNLISHPSDINFSELNLYSDTQTNGTYNDSLGSGASGSPHFSMFGGASIKTLAGGENCYELDNNGEYIERTNAFNYFKIIPGQTYCLKFIASGESLVDASDPVDYEAHITWVGAVGSVGNTFTQDSTLAEERRMYFTAPTGATNASVKIIRTFGTNGVDHGVNIRQIRIFRDDFAYVKDWDIVIPTTSAVATVNDYGIIEGSNIMLDTTLPAIVTLNEWVSIRKHAWSDIVANTSYKWFVAVKRVVGKSWPKMQVCIEFFKDDGTFISIYSSPEINIVAPSSFAVVQNSYPVPEDATKAIMSLRLITNGAVVVGFLISRDARETSIYTYGDTLEILASYSSGRQIRITGEAATYEEAQNYIDSWRTSRVSNNTAPEIVDVIGDEFPSFNKPIRIVEDNTSHPLESFTYDIQAGTMTRYLSVKKQTLEDIIAQRRKTSSFLS